MSKTGQKITKKFIKNKNSAHSCHDIAVAVLRVQGPPQIQKQTEKIIKTRAESWYTHDQFANRVKKEPVAKLLNGLCSGYLNIETAKKKLEKIAGK